jgi:hypothetical protein
MGLDIYVRWVGQTPVEVEAQVEAYGKLDAGHLGYLCEPHSGHPFAASYLVMEAFGGEGGAWISAATLRQRLPDTLRLAEIRVRRVYGVTDREKIARILQNYTEFVALCERKEKEGGVPVNIFWSL